MGVYGIPRLPSFTWMNKPHSGLLAGLSMVVVSRRLSLKRPVV
jgi:hypothetical protein